MYANGLEDTEKYGKRVKMTESYLYEFNGMWKLIKLWKKNLRHVKVHVFEYSIEEIVDQEEHVIAEKKKEEVLSQSSQTKVDDKQNCDLSRKYILDKNSCHFQTMNKYLHLNETSIRVQIVSFD